MRFVLSIFFILILHYGFSQAERKANDYFEAGSKLEEDLFYREAFPYFLKSSELAIEGSELWLKAVYKTGYLYNYAEIADKPLITQRTIKGLRYLRKQNFSGSFAADYFFRAGLAFKRDYRPDSAIYFFSEAKNGYQSLSDDEKVSDCYHGIGDVYKDVLFDFNSAESFYEKALAVREKVKRSELNVFLVSKLHYELASVNKSQHEYDKALAYSLKNIAFIEGLPIMYNANKSLAYVNAAEIYTEIDSFSRAENLYQKAITLNKRSSPYRIDPALGEYYYGLATVFKKKGEINSAIKYLLKALAIFNSISGPKNVFKIISYQKLGEAYQAINEMELSGFYFRKGIQLLHDFGLRKSGQASELYRLMGNYFAVNQKMDSALLYYQYSLIAASNKFKSTKFKTNPLQNDIRLGDFAYETLLAKSEILSLQYKKQGKRYFADHAIQVLDLAEKLLLDSRANLDMDNSKWTFFDSNFGLYQKALSLLYQLETNAHNDTLIRKAFYYMESSKTKMLTDALNEAEFTRTLITSDSLIQFLDLQRRNLYQLQDEFKRQEGNSSKQVMLHNSIIDVDRKIQRTENEIQLKYPAYIKTKYRQEIPDITKIQSFTEEQKMTVIEFFWGITDVFGLGINGNKIIFKRIGATDSIKQIIKNVHAVLSSDQYDNDVKVFEKNSALLYQQLVAPFSDIIKSVNRIVIIPDGPIEQIPFEVLVSKRKRDIGQNFSTLNYLLKDYFISYSFSSVYLLNTIRKEGLKNPRMLAFGFTQGEQFRSLNKEVETKKSGLPGSETELKSILSQFPEGEYHFGKEVTEEMFKVKAPDFDLIHLAVHGSGSTEQSYSASLFFKDSIISKEDGRLHWYELFGIRLKARLAVISSCESGIGKSYRGEGMLSMASAFAFAGCKNIVMGLWRVDDRVSSDLMSRFYRNLQAGEPVDVALTKSKREYLENSDNLTSNPKLWASLISYGNEQVIETDNKLLYWSLFSILIFICFFFILMRYKKGLPVNR